MSELGQHPTSTFAVWADAFSSAELDVVEALGDRLTVEKATLFNTLKEDDVVVQSEVRITQTAWMEPNPETKWIYDRLQGVARSLNDRVYQFDLRGFSENLQYTIYHSTEGGHYDWHVDHGPIRVRRKLSFSLQITDPSLYDGCDLLLQAGNKIETAPRDRGCVIAFPSYVLHRVTPCTRGTRKAIVAWTTGPQFR